MISESNHTHKLERASHQLSSSQAQTLRLCFGINKPLCGRVRQLGCVWVRRTAETDASTADCWAQLLFHDKDYFPATHPLTWMMKGEFCQLWPTVLLYISSTPSYSILPRIKTGLTEYLLENRLSLFSLNPYWHNTFMILVTPLWLPFFLIEQLFMYPFTLPSV